MTGSGETFIRCRYCGRLLNVGDLEPNEVYCKKCDRTFDVNECEVVLRGISCIPSDYHYEWKEEKNLEDELTKYKRVFEILKDELNIELGKEEHTFKDFKDIYYYMSIKPAWQDTKTTFELSQKEYELLEELIGNENS